MFLLALRVNRLSKGAPPPAHNPPTPHHQATDPPKTLPPPPPPQSQRDNIKAVGGADGDRQSLEAAKVLPDPRCHGQGGANRLRPPGARRAAPVEKPSLAGDESSCSDTAGRAQRRSPCPRQRPRCPKKKNQKKTLGRSPLPESATSSGEL